MKMLSKQEIEIFKEMCQEDQVKKLMGTHKVDEVFEVDEAKSFNTPDHYLIAGLIETKPLIDMILNSGIIEEYKLSPSQLFELGNVLKYRLRAGKKDIASAENDIFKALDFEKRLANG